MEVRAKLETGRNSFFREGAPYLGLGLQLAAGVIIFYYLGSWADGKLHTSPWLMLTGVFVGVLGGFIKFFRTAAKLSKQEPTKKETK